MGAASWHSPLSSGSAGLKEEGPVSFFQPPYTDDLSQVRPQADTQTAEFDQETVAGLSQPQWVFTSDHQRVEDVQGSSREEIRDKGVVGGADSSRLEEREHLLGISSRSSSRVLSIVREALRVHCPSTDRNVCRLEAPSSRRCLALHL